MPADRSWDGERVVRWLVEEAELREVVQRACADAGAAGWEEQVAYCLVVLVRKDDPERRGVRAIKLDPGSDDFVERLDLWAHEVARNLTRWGETYARIQDEARRYEVTTLRGLIGHHHADDAIDVLADKLGETLAHCPPLEEMTLGHARTHDPGRADYVFSTPLGQWVRTSWNRVKPRDAPPEEPPAGDPDGPFARLVERIAALGKTRGWLPPTIDRVQEMEGALADRHETSDPDDALLARVRAALVYLADGLLREQRALRPMLAYLALALPRASQMQRVAVLSLCDDANERDAVEAFRHGLRAAVDDEHQPTPALVVQVRDAVERGLPAVRVKTLDELRAAPGRRASLLAPVAQMLVELPASVHGVAGIAHTLGIRRGIVATTRDQTRAELDKVDPWYDRVFRRYTMGIA